jgi:two-component system cell cycle sensor histidine kinase/response regulator CckA
VTQVGERVLVVEDDAVVRRLLDMQLSRLGYDVVTAADGAEALERHRECGVDLLVTDIVMPGMSGEELAAALRAANPRLRVLFLSGYGIGSAVHGPVGFLQKPFSADELAAALDGLRRTAPAA